MMRIFQVLFLLLAVAGAISPAVAGDNRPMLKATFSTITLYYGLGRRGDRALTMDVTVTSPDGVSYGVWKLLGLYKGSQVPLISWSGAGPAPTIVLKDFDNSVDSSHCPGLSGSHWEGCGSYSLDITVKSDDYGCPWLASSHTTATESIASDVYISPDVRSSICPKVPVDTFDISWDPNTVKHETSLKLKSTGGTVNSTLQTYLMESGKLCDSSQLDERGAYCRYVATGTRLTVLGCDQNAVKTTAVEHPLTDVALHDINVSVDTKNIGNGAFMSTCNFQYLLEEI